MGRKYYGRYTEFIQPDVEKCKFHDESVIYVPKTGEAYYKNVDDIWKAMKLSIEQKVQEAMKNGNLGVEKTGGELLHWIGARDTYALAMVLNMYWEYCWTHFFSYDTPLEVIDFILNLRFKDGEEMDNIMLKE